MKTIRSIENFEVSESFSALDQYVAAYTAAMKAADDALDSFKDENSKNAIMADAIKSARDLKSDLKKLMDKSKAAGIWEEKK